MRKCLVWLFLVALLFSLSSCAPAVAPADTHAELLALLDEGRYEDAMDYIRELQEEGTTVSPTVENATPTGTPSCQHSNTERRHEKEATFTEEGFSGDLYCLDCNKKLEDGQTVPVRTDYKTVTITMDNWSDYLEFYDCVWAWNYNAFGEFENCRIEKYLAIKEEFANQLIGEKSELAAEMKSTYRNSYIKADVPTETLHILGPVTEHGFSTNTYTQTLNDWRVDENGRMRPAFYFCWTSCYQSDISVGELDIPSNCEITRIQGTLYFAEN